jgi:hypothetical protein
MSSGYTSGVIAFLLTALAVAVALHLRRASLRRGLANSKASTQETSDDLASENPMRVATPKPPQGPPSPSNFKSFSEAAGVKAPPAVDALKITQNPMKRMTSPK